MRFFFLLVLNLISLCAWADWSPYRVDSPAPALLFHNYLLNKNEALFSYQFQSQSSDVAIEGKKILRSSDVFGDGFSYYPSSFETRIHTLSLAWAYADDLNLYLNVSLTSHELKLTQNNAGSSHSSSSGLSDPEFGMTWLSWEGGRNRIIQQLGLSLPLGSTITTGSSENQNDRLPYLMQLGSGHPNLLLSSIYLGQVYRMTWGASAQASLPLGYNSHGYQIGEKYAFNLWMNTPFNEWWSMSLRASHQRQNNIYGHDDQIYLKSADSPLNAESMQAHHSTELGLGMSFMGFGPENLDHRLFLEYVFVGDQFTSGIQFQKENYLGLRYQFLF